jgi:TonB family protein
METHERIQGQAGRDDEEVRIMNKLSNSRTRILRIFQVFLGIAVIAPSARGEARILRTNDYVNYSVDVGYPDGECLPIGGYNKLLSHLDYSAREAGLKGVVVVRPSLARTGRVVAAQILQSPHPSLSALVLRAVKRSEWKPNVAGGAGRACVTQFAVDFGRTVDTGGTHSQMKGPTHAR